MHEVKKNIFLRYFNDYFHNYTLKKIYFLFFYTDTNIAFQRFPLQNEMLQESNRTYLASDLAMKIASKLLLLTIQHDLL